MAESAETPVLRMLRAVASDIAELRQDMRREFECVGSCLLAIEERLAAAGVESER